jgi:hypothetical protein
VAPSNKKVAKENQERPQLSHHSDGMGNMEAPE